MVVITIIEMIAVIMTKGTMVTGTVAITIMIVTMIRADDLGACLELSAYRIRSRFLPLEVGQISAIHRDDLTGYVRRLIGR